MFRAGRGRDLPKWPAWCFLPMAAWYAIVSEDAGQIRVPPNRGADIGRLAAIGTWRYGQGIYQFDPDVFAALWDTRVTGDIPGDVLLRLPEWCVYVETAGKSFAGNVLHGFFVHLEWDVNDHRHELRLLLDTEDFLLPVPLHIGDWPLTGAIKRTINESTRHIPAGTLVQLPGADQVSQFADLVEPIISLVLYICSDKPDFGPDRRPQRPKPKRTKKGWRLFPPAGPTIWHVGQIIGKALRDTDTNNGEGEADRRVRAHLRRGHWHGYWTGPRSGPQQYRYHWLPPMLVGGEK